MKSALFASLFLMAPFAGATLIPNGNFEDVSGTFPNGWATTPTPAAVTGIVPGSATAAELQTGEGIHQDFAPTPGSGLFNFQLDLAFRTSVAPANDGNINRIRLRGDNNAGDLITLSLEDTGIRSFSGTWADDLTGVSIAANTTYYIRVTGSNLDLPGRTFTLGFSTDGISYTTAAPSTRFHFAPVGTAFETIRLEGLNATFTVDNVSVVPEAATSAMLAVGLLVLRVFGAAHRK